MHNPYTYTRQVLPNFAGYMLYHAYLRLPKTMHWRVERTGLLKDVVDYIYADYGYGNKPNNHNSVVFLRMSRQLMFGKMLKI